MATRENTAPATVGQGAGPALAVGRSRYSLRQRLAFVAALLIMGAASFYAGLGLLTRAYPAVFPGENAPFSSVLTSLPGPAKVSQPGAESVFNQRTNILVVGIDRRPHEPVVGPHRTDAIMVATIDPVTKIASLLSFPRDLYIEQTRADGSVAREARINESWVVGHERGGSLDASAEQLIADIEHNFGIEIDNWVMLDFFGVEALVNAIGGIEIDVPEELAVYNWWYSDESGRFPPHYISFPPGPQRIDGYEAVAFSRNRSPTDLERVKRQALIIETAAKEAISRGFLNDPMGTYNAYRDTVHHDVAVSRIPGLANLLLDARGEINTYSIGDPVDGVETVRDHVTPTGAQVLLWNRENARYWVNQVFTQSTYAQSNVEIQNGYGMGGGEQVEKLGRYLRFAKGFPSVYRGPDVDAQPTSSIVVYSEARLPMARDIAEWLSVPESAIAIEDTDNPTLPDIVIIIGEDFLLPGG